MRRFLFSAASLIAITAVAAASDLPARSVLTVPAPSSAPVFTWSGVYGGVNAGGARSRQGLTFDGQNPYGGLFNRDAGLDPFAAVAGGDLDSIDNAGFASRPTKDAVRAARDTLRVGMDAFTAAQDRSVTGADTFSFAERNNRNSFTAGAQLGYNAQFGSIVLGVEGDVNWLGGRRGDPSANATDFSFEGEYFANAGALNFYSGANPFDPGGTFPGVSGLAFSGGLLNNLAGDPTGSGSRAGTLYNGAVTTSGGRSAWLSTLRGRAGFALDRFMVYGTGGLALQAAGRTTSSSSLTRTDCRPDMNFDTLTPTSSVNIPGACVSTTNSYVVHSPGRKQVGWAAGLGFEWAMLNNVSLGVEYLRVNFGEQRIDFVDPVLTAAADTRAARVRVRAGTDEAPAGPAPTGVIRSAWSKDSHDLVRMKLNYRFDGGSSAPVLARY